MAQRDYDETLDLDTLELHSEYYKGRNLRAEAEDIRIGLDHHLFIYRDGTNASAFWYYAWAGGPSTDATGTVVEGPKVELVFHGWATDLDGVRHLYFADDGYIFYPQSIGLVEALQELYNRCPGEG